MALDVNAARFLLALRESTQKDLAAARAKINAAQVERDVAKAMLDKIDTALAPFNLSIDTAPIPGSATLDEVIARLTV